MDKKFTKHIFLYALMFFLMSSISFAGVTGSDFESEEKLKGKIKSRTSETMDKAQESWDNLSTSVTQDYVELPQKAKETASTCLNGILNADYGFSLGVPSPSDFLNSACDEVKSYAEDRLQALEQSYNFTSMSGFFDFGADIGLTGDGFSDSVDVDKKGADIADTVWDQINTYE